MVARFLEEAQITGQLQHPGVPPVHEIGRLADGRPFLAMKLIEGRTLKDLLAERSDPSHDLPRFLTIFEQVCQTLAYAHARHVIHRDLKPNNIMVGAFGEVQVMDWGLAKALTPANTSHESAQAPEAKSLDMPRSDTAVGPTEAGVVLGTLAFMPSEQARGEIDRVDDRSDVFGLGAILCVILTGHPPYQERSREKLWEKAKNADLGDALARLDSCHADAELVTLAKHCLAKNQCERPRDGAALAETVAAYQASVQERLRRAELERAAAEVKAREERKRRRLTVALAASVLTLVLLAVGGWLWIQQQKAARIKETADKVNPIVEESTQLRAEAKALPVPDMTKWQAALEAAKRAKAAQDAGEADAERQREVADFLAELEGEFETAQMAAAQIAKNRQMVQTLEQIRIHNSDVRDGRFYYDEADSRYAAAFRDYGINLDTLTDSRAAEEIAAQSIKADLVAALDDWFHIRATVERPPYKSALRMIQIAKQADPDPERCLLRDALRGGNKDTLERLAANPNVLDWPAGTLIYLGRALEEMGEPHQAVSLLSKAQERHPSEFYINFSLATTCALLDPPQLDDAIRYYMTAISLRGQSPTVWRNFAKVLHGKGLHEEAVGAYRQAIRLMPDYAEAYNDMGTALHKIGRQDEAIAALQAAIRAKPSLAQPYANLGRALMNKGDSDGAARHLAEFVRLDPLNADGYHDLGIALIQKGDIVNAISGFRAAIRLKPNWAAACLDLGITLQEMDQWDEAIVQYREAIRLSPGYDEAYCNLGHALIRKGHFAEALASLRRGHELGSQKPNWNNPSKQWVTDCERLVEMEKRFQAILKGEAKPANAHEKIAFATVCATKGLYGRASQLYLECFAEEPGLLQDRHSGLRFEAARAAARAGCESRNGQPPFDEKTRASWRKQALQWLQADLDLWMSGPSRAQVQVVEKLRHWPYETDLAGLRDSAALAKLPEAEQEACRKLWARVDLMLSGARNNAPDMKQSEHLVSDEVRRFEGDTDGVTSVALSADGRYILSAGFDRIVRLWDVQTGEELKRLPGHPGTTWAVAFSPDGRYAVSGGQDHPRRQDWGIRLWDVKARREIRQLTGHEEVISSLVFSKDSREVISGCWDRTIRAWDVEGKKQSIVFNMSVPILSLALSPDQRHILVGSNDGFLRLIDRDKGQELHKFQGPEGFVESVAFSPDGGFALSGGADQTIQLYDLKAGKEVRRLKGHTGKVDCVAFSPDGKRILSCGEDKTIRLWEAESGKELHCFRGHLARVRSIALSHDGRHFISGSYDKTVRLWKMPE
jgi:serine/threonine-protein kinase